MRARFFAAGSLDEASVRRAAPGGDRDQAWLVAPTRERALVLDKAYRVLVASQRFAHGRDALLVPPPEVHPRVREEQRAADQVFLDGRLHLEWWS